MRLKVQSQNLKTLVVKANLIRLTRKIAVIIKIKKKVLTQGVKLWILDRRKTLRVPHKHMIKNTNLRTQNSTREIIIKLKIALDLMNIQISAKI